MNSSDKKDHGKRHLSPTASTGESPDFKKHVLASRLQMPCDAATELEWNQTIYKKVDELFDNFQALKQSFDFNQEELAKCKNEVIEMKDEINQLKTQMKELQCEREQLKLQNRALVESHITTELHMREQNLVFEGIQETYGEDKHMLYNKIVQILSHMMVFNGQADKVPITKIQRMGGYMRGNIRPVRCQFLRDFDVDIIVHNRGQLPKDIYVREDFPPEIEDRRRVLRPIFKKAKSLNEFKGKCKLNVDKLVIDGRTYTVAPYNNLNKLPKPLQPREAAEKSNDTAVVFFTQGSPFSNFHPAPFVRNNQRYVCNEQYIQAKKAELFDDDYTHAKIMHSTNPFEIKSLGGKVRGFVRQKWEQHARQIVTEGCMAKFTQNHELLKALIETGNKAIGEASRDPLWGIGKSLAHPNVLAADDWQGENILGNVLMNIREQLS